MNKECLNSGHEFPLDDDSISRCLRCGEHPIDTIRKFEDGESNGTLEENLESFGKQLRGKPTNLREKLKEILQEPFTDGWYNTIEKKREAILQAFKEVVPGEKVIMKGYDPDNDVDENIGFNKCRQEILERLEELK